MKHTPLFPIHERLGARLIDFGQWRMPVYYKGVIEEHNAVRKAVGLFDVSHMGQVHIEGAEATQFLRHLLTNDVAECVDLQAQYTAMCRPGGGIVDDLISYRISEHHYILVVNASNKDKDIAWITENAAQFDVQISDKSDDNALIAVQGPNAETLLSRLTQANLTAVKYYHFIFAELAGVRCQVSRTGYTGEDGFEVSVPSGHAVALWERLMEEGQDLGVAPIGLGARDSLRLEMKFALYGNDIDETTHPLEAGLGWIVKLDRGDFSGRAALISAKETGLTRRLVGFELLEKNVPRHGYRVLNEGGEAIGYVTSGAIAPSLGRPIGMAYVPVALSKIGSQFFIEVRQRRVPAVVVKTPFYKRPAKG